MRKTICVCVTVQRKALRFYDCCLFCSTIVGAVIWIPAPYNRFLLIKKMIEIGKVVISIVNFTCMLMCFGFFQPCCAFCNNNFSV